MTPIFKGEFAKCQVEPSDKCPKPPFPKMQGNRLRLIKNDWCFEGVVCYPSGKKKKFGLLIPGQQESDALVVINTEQFWRDLWETLIICMQGEGEGLDIGQRTTRH